MEWALELVLFCVAPIGMVLLIGIYIELNKMRTMMEEDHPQKK